MDEKKLGRLKRAGEVAVAVSTGNPVALGRIAAKGFKSMMPRKSESPCKGPKVQPPM